MKKILTLNEVPITSRLHLTYPLIATANHPDGEAYVYNHFINTECKNDSSLQDIDFCYLPYLCRDQVSYVYYLHERSVVRKLKQESLIESLISYIDEGLYVQIHLDDFYLKGKHWHQKEHYAHVNMIYGYDLQAREFYTVGYDANRKYLAMTASFDSVFDSYQGEAVSYVIVCSKANPQKSFNFSKTLLARELEDYLLSRNTLESPEDLEFFGIRKEDYVFGLSTYDYIIGYLENVLAQKTDYDDRHLVVVSEHKKLMVSRILYLMEKQSLYHLHNLLPSVQVMLDDSILCKNVMYKWYFTREKEYGRETLDLLGSLQKKDRKFTEDFLALL